MLRVLFMVAALIAAGMGASVSLVMPAQERPGELLTPASVTARKSSAIAEFSDDDESSSDYEEDDDRDVVSEASDCAVHVSSLGGKLPVLLTNGHLSMPSDSSGFLRFNKSDVVTVSCQGRHGDGNWLEHENSEDKRDEATFSCVSGDSFVSSWLGGRARIEDVHCSYDVEALQSKRGPCASDHFPSAFFIDLGVPSSGLEHAVASACFDPVRAATLWVEYDQTPGVKVVLPRKNVPFAQGTYFPGIPSVNSLYKARGQKKAINAIFNSDDAADRFITSSNSLNRGHMAARSDFVLTPSQRATFAYVNVAPQWRLFNSGNWNVLERGVRNMVVSEGIYTRIYTGTIGVMELTDNGETHEIYLHPSEKQIPVPLWYYKVVHEPATRKGVVYLGLNNPHVESDEAMELAARVCPDICDSTYNPWRRDRKNVEKGFSICCSVESFRKTVLELPSFDTSGGLLFSVERE